MNQTDRKILSLLTLGLRNISIAQQLGVTPKYISERLRQIVIEQEGYTKGHVRTKLAVQCWSEDETDSFRRS